MFRIRYTYEKFILLAVIVAVGGLLYAVYTIYLFRNMDPDLTKTMIQRFSIHPMVFIIGEYIPPLIFALVLILVYSRELTTKFLAKAFGTKWEGTILYITEVHKAPKQLIPYVKLKVKYDNAQVTTPYISDYYAKRIVSVYCTVWVYKDRIWVDGYKRGRKSNCIFENHHLKESFRYHIYDAEDFWEGK
ncbi:MAG: hypothetical protein IJ079_03730 [Lachnospiraceae bacterium]|nr:hypothetical protein [Lachnospiraceae bacterium]